MPNRIVDTGYGLERLTWAASGSPTIYDAVFPDLVSSLFAEAGLDHHLSDKNYTKILALNAKFAGLMDISGANLFALRKKVAAAIDVPIDRLTKMITPVEQIYTIADHSRCLAYMLGDCIVPSNVREGYLARLVLRRTLRVMNDLNLDLSLADLVGQQVEAIGEEQFEQSPEVIREILDRETEKYAATIERGTRIVQKVAATYKKKSQKVPLAEVITLYDSHGLPAELIKEVAAAEGAVVELPDNFYSLVANMHSESKREAGDEPLAAFEERVAALPPTRPLYYEQPCEVEFEAIVIDFFDGMVVLDQTLFYPEGGGQPADTGTLLSADSMVRVEDVVKMGDVILHRVAGGALKRGEKVKGMVDEERRWSLMRHHTATHVLLHAAKEILGAHVHQAGAQKGSDSARLDIRHFKHITEDELRRIELRANQIVQSNKPVFIKLEERQRAEQKYGFTLYQGGVPPGGAIRVVQVGGEIQACAGTHVRTTGEIGAVKILRVEHIQDGIERIEFAAGRAAIVAMQETEQILAEAAAELRIQPENLPSTVQRFFGEWKERGKEIERLRKSRRPRARADRVRGDRAGDGRDPRARRGPVPARGARPEAREDERRRIARLVGGAAPHGPRLGLAAGERGRAPRRGLRGARRQGRRQRDHGPCDLPRRGEGGRGPEGRAPAHHDRAAWLTNRGSCTRAIPRPRPWPGQSRRRPRGRSCRSSARSR